MSIGNTLIRILVSGDASYKGLKDCADVFGKFACLDISDDLIEEALNNVRSGQHSKNSNTITVVSNYSHIFTHGPFKYRIPKKIRGKWHVKYRPGEWNPLKNCIANLRPMDNGEFVANNITYGIIYTFNLGIPHNVP